MRYENFIFPDDLLYDKDYSWVKVEKYIATVGVIDYGAKLVKQFVFVNLPKLGNVKKGDIYVSLEAVKWTGHLKSPVSGNIIEVNDKLFDSPEIMNQDPYGEGWIMKVKLGPNKDRELSELINAKQAVELCKSRCYTKINK